MQGGSSMRAAQHTCHWGCCSPKLLFVVPPFCSLSLTPCRPCCLPCPLHRRATRSRSWPCCTRRLPRHALPLPARHWALSQAACAAVTMAVCLAVSRPLLHRGKRCSPSACSSRSMQRGQRGSCSTRRSLLRAPRTSHLRLHALQQPPSRLAAGCPLRRPVHPACGLPQPPAATSAALPPTAPAAAGV